MLQTLITATPLAFALLVLYGALSDLSSFRIPNVVPYVLVLLYALFTLLVWWNTPYLPSMSFVVPRWVFDVAIGLFTFVITTVFWKMGKLGGGDVKYLSAVAVWAGVKAALPFIVLTSVFAILFYLSVKLIRGWNFIVQATGLPQFVKQLLDRVGNKEIPYGFPAGIAAMAVLPQIFGLGT
jgi:prepilin peptidase CpaA